jgi:hypothetical protein
MLCFVPVQWNLSNSTHQGIGVMFRIVQGVKDMHKLYRETTVYVLDDFSDPF